MKLKTIFAGALLAVFGLTLHAAEPAGSFVHYTPEKLDAVTQAEIEKMIANPIVPKTKKGLDAFIKKTRCIILQ